MYEKVKGLEEQVAGMKVEKEEEVASYVRLRDQLTKLGEEFHGFLTDPQYIVRFMNPGRLVKVKNQDQDFGWGAVVHLEKIKSTVTMEEQMMVKVLLHVTKESASSKIASELRAVKPGEKGEMTIVTVLFPLIQQISSARIYIPDDLKPLDKRMAVLNAIKEVQRRCENRIPLVDPEKDMKINTPEFKTVVTKIKTFERRLQKHSLHGTEGLSALIEQYRAKAAVEADLIAAKHHLKKSKSLLQMDELKCMKRVLRRLGYCSTSDVIEIKGRIACELSSADELLLTEMMFNGLFNPLNPCQVYFSFKITEIFILLMCV